MSFKSALNSIGNGIKDLSQLNVRTYTGTINANVAGEDATEMLQSARANGTLKLVGITTINMDGDVDQFISEDSTIDDKLHGSHYTAVQAGQRSRQATVALFSSALENTMKNLTGDTN